MMDSRNPSRRGYNGGYFRDTAYYSQRNSTAGSRTLPASSGRGSNNQQLQQQSQHSYISSDRRPDRIRTAGRGRSGLYHLQHPQISDQSDMSHQVASRQSYAQQPLETKNGRVSSSGPRESNFSGPNKRGNQEHRHKGVGGVNDSSRHFSAAQQPARFSEQRSTEGPEMATSNSVSRRRNAPSSTAVAGYHHDKQHELLEPDNSVGGQEGRSVNDGEDSRCHPPQSDNM
ncbi:unnamed protein product [Protopolystoma xenopodis]|uniref:Uncharacterized protein n=1 Tax=Protopolystoma xenopodis TaxID=117903 RepID=A0A448X4Z3_9PLAT|nr:unnamed protein product [Protopolystoma xenopodis]